ncbi:unnamed protein product [Phyllotreta striolata]|uniref:RING-type E3 ubiquitin transferase n=1 Tax=Phyllotreta striolata TaxID=444603 RepID=A0A9N9TJ46_PHYSR|nr:unnamed protein product [Phyllotreta striolata]
MADNNSVVNLEATLRTKFECPVCFKYMIPPIRLCLSGHIYCDYCFEKIRKCALCRANKSAYRCIVLEQIYAMLTFPCKYAEHGCNFVGKGDIMTTHQDYCEYSSAFCPLRFNRCQWKGMRSEMVTHCNDIHADNTFFVTEQKLKVTNFCNLMDRNYFIIFYVYDNLFRCVWDIKQDTGVMRFAVYSLCLQNSDKLFSYRISVLFEGADVISLEGPCFHMNDDNMRFLDKKYLSTNYNMIRDFCDTNGDINYTINIIKK